MNIENNKIATYYSKKELNLPKIPVLVDDGVASIAAPGTVRDSEVVAAILVNCAPDKYIPDSQYSEVISNSQIKRFAT